MSPDPIMQESGCFAYRCQPKATELRASGRVEVEVFSHAAFFARFSKRLTVINLHETVGGLFPTADGQNPALPIIRNIP